MFGLAFEKLFVVALLAAIIIGPRRLPEYAALAASALRRATGWAAQARHRLDEETKVVDWRTLDPRQYDPRRIIREAWADAEAREGADAHAARDGEADAVPSDARPALTAAAPEAAPGRWIVTGSSAHPRRVWEAAER
ncbi:Sec-independent protein translocase TatB [Microbacterium sp.]|uniref:Sec-independent protein translocase TatB n=1 Tax=Microbacterium sp. TaxID=51671 RepID=UPI0039E60978